MTDPETELPFSASTLAKLRNSLPPHPVSGNTSTIRHSQVEFIASLVDDAGIAAQLDRWQAEDRPAKGPGGARRTVNTRAVLVLLLLLGAENSPLLVEKMSVATRYRLSNESLQYLGLWGKRRTKTQWYFNIWRALQRALDVIDPKPGKRKMFPTPEDIEATLKRREDEGTHRKQQRLDWVCNQILEATLRLMPDEVQSNWQGDVCIDASVIEAYGKRGKPWGGTHLPIEYDGGWYLRTSNHESTTDRTQAKKAIFGWDMTIAVQTNHDPACLPDFPLLVAGIGMTIPGTDLIGTGRRIHESIASRWNRTGRSTGDRGYAPAAKPEDYQIPLRNLGYDIVTDYKKDQLGAMEGYAGAIQVEGALYCPSMPEQLIEATKDLRAGSIDHKTWRLRIAERRQYRLRAKEKPDEHGNVPMMCPARGPGATVRCPLVDSGCAAGDDSKTPILKPPTAESQDRICTNKTSVTVPIEAAAKFMQSMHYGSAEWQEVYSSDRNTIEGQNGFLKDGAHESIKDATRRRVRGYTAQYLLITVLVAAGNLRKIDKFVADLLSQDTVGQQLDKRKRKLETRAKRKNRENRVGPWGDYKPPAPAADTDAG